MNKQKLIEFAEYLEAEKYALENPWEDIVNEYLQSHPVEHKTVEEILNSKREDYPALLGMSKDAEKVILEAMQEYAQQDIEYNKIQNQFKVIEAIQEYNQQDIELPSETDKNRLTREYRYNRKINDIESEWYQDFRNGFDSAIKAIEQLIKNK